MSEKKEIEIFKSNLVPKHEILSEEDKAKLLEDYKVNLRQLPRIKIEDPVVKLLGGKKDDILKIKRSSPVSGDYNYYRVIIGDSKK